MAEAGNWCLIESDPGVFSEMLRGFGVEGLQVEELYSLDEIEKSLMKPVYGLVFLFKWRQGDEAAGVPTDNTDVFFAQQVITNACATQALINMLMNVQDPSVKLGKILQEYKDFAAEFDSSTRGLCLSNSDAIRTVHNSFARPTLYELDTKGGEAEDNYHFVTYVPVGGKVYELDGLREFPLEVAEIADKQDWLDAVRPVIQTRIQKYSEGEIHFNLMAVIPDRKARYEEMLEKLIEANADHSLDEQIAEIKTAIVDEEEKTELYRKENARRRHNYLPFLLELMKALAREGKLVGLMDKAVSQAKARAGLMSTDKTMLELKRKQ